MQKIILHFIKIIFLTKVQVMIVKVKKKRFQCILSVNMPHILPILNGDILNNVHGRSQCFQREF